MIPYLRYLYCLFLLHDREEDVISSELSRYGLPCNKAILDLAYDRFLQKLESHSKVFSSCLIMDLYDDEFDACARTLDIFQYIDGDEISRKYFKIVSDSLIKKHVECCLLTRVPIDTIVSDVLDIYRVDISVEDVVSFASLFFDSNEITDTANFIKYVESLQSMDERTLKSKCRANGPEYTRWAVGAKVVVDAKTMTKDMMTDAYFRYKEAYSERSPAALDTALKLGNLVTKFIDRDVKLGTAKFTGPAGNEKDEFGEQLCLFQFSDEPSKTVAELRNENNTPPS